MSSNLPPLPDPWIYGGVIHAPIDGTFTANQMRAYGEACAAAAVAAERDCRTCANFTTKSGGCVSVVQCLDADCFKPTAPRRYWSIRARGET